MSDTWETFDDPALKAAVRRVCSAERTPEQLRQRISRMMSESSPADPHLDSPPPANLKIALWNRPALRWDAVLLPALGGLYAWVAPGDRPAHIGSEVLAAMVQTHDDCWQLATHIDHGADVQDLRAIANALCAKLAEPVLVANLAEDGWQFRGAAICKVNGHDCAHLMFTKQGQRMSVFSLPASSCNGAVEGGIYAVDIDGHAVAGFVRAGGAFTMVGHCPKRGLKSQEVATLLRKHQGDVIASATPVSDPGQFLDR
jgi:anti-sigma factor RsiW